MSGTNASVSQPGTARTRTEVLTIVFTDIAGSTRIKQELGDGEGVLLIERHHAVLHDVLRECPDGRVANTMGDGFLLLFARPSDAVRFALLFLARMRVVNLAACHRIDDRIAIHTGEVVLCTTSGELRGVFGMQIDAAGKLVTLAGPNQIVVTRFSFDNARQILQPADLPGIGPLTWLNHGCYVVEGVEDPIELCEVGERDHSALLPPTSSPKGRRLQLQGEDAELSWRPSVGGRVDGTHWILIRKLGEGGFGEVWVAQHERIRQQRVFKFCFREDRARSLRREITLFRLLHERLREHPHIVRIEDVYLDRPPFFLSMEYIEGEDLLRWCEKHGGLDKIAIERRLEVVAQVADALAAAHRAGVLHRDVKPSNILIGADTEGATCAKLTDFGIGQVVSQEALAGITNLGFTVTVLPVEGVSNSGTRLYMAPELVAGRAATPQSDIYSLGLVLYQLVIGDFSRPLTVDWARRVGDPLLREDLDQCFAGDPAERFADAELLAQRLRSLPARRRERDDAEAVAFRRERAAYRRGIYRAASIAGVVVILLAGVATVAWRNELRARANNERSEATLDFMLKELRFKLEPAGRRDVLLAVIDEVIRRQAEINVRSGTINGRVREARAHVLRGDVYLYRVETEPAEAAYRRAQELLNGVLAQQPQHDEARRLEASLGYKFGDVSRLLGEEGSCAALTAQSQAAFERLLAEAAASGGPPHPELARDAAMAFEKHAGRQSDPLERSKWHAEAYRLRQVAVAARPGQLQWQFELAQSLAALAELDVLAGDFAAAHQRIDESRSLTQSLLAQEPRSGTWEHHLGVLSMTESECRLGEVDAGEAMIGSAVTQAQDAVDVLERVAFSDLGNVWWQYDLARAYQHSAACLRRNRNVEGATEHERKAGRIFAQLREEYADVPFWQEILSESAP